MTGMGFTMAKGLSTMLFSECLNRTGDIAAILATLRDGTVPGSEWGLIDDAAAWDAVNAAMGGPIPTGDLPAVRDQAKLHFRNHWFATHQHANGTYLTPTHIRNGVAGTSLGTTGWWQRWRGDAECILREGLIRAIEAGLWIDHDDPMPASPRLKTLIDMQWLCGGSRFECWVSWETGYGSGKSGTDVVTLTVLTPGIDSTVASNRPPSTGNVKLYSSWDSSFNPVAAVRRMDQAHCSTKALAGPWAGKAPPDTSEPRGSIVVGHRRNGTGLLFPSTEPTSSGNWFKPFLDELGLSGAPSAIWGAADDFIDAAENDVAVVEPSFSEHGLYKP